MTEPKAREEKETIITFNEAEPDVNVFTYNHRWQQRMKEMGLKPIRTEGEAREYEFPKKWLKLPRKPRRLTPEQQEAARQRIKAGSGHRKNPVFRPKTP